MAETRSSEESVMPLSALTGGSGDAGEGSGADTGAEALLASSASRRRSPWAGMLVIVLVIAVAAAGLYFMRRIGVGGSFAFANIEIEIPDSLNNRDDLEVVMRDISEKTTEKQVPLQNVKKNPFYIARQANPTDDVEPARVDNGEQERLERERAERARLAAVEKAYKSLKLQSIMGGSRPMAMIDGRLHQIGARINEYFKITRIDDRSVEIRTEAGEAYTLTLGE